MSDSKTDSGSNADGNAGNDIPRFAVVGRQNKGKSSVLATLVEQADNDKIRIGPTPGETTRCYSVPLQLNGETLIEFIDTPGFSRARQALAWLKENHPETEGVARIDTVRRFVEEHRQADGGGEFPDECELLTPILAGAGIVYVVDGSKPFRPDFVAEFEILRWTGRPRMAVLNNQSDDSDHSDAWREHLGEAFNLTREFDAHEAQFDERIRLLRHLLEIEDRQQERISKTIDLVEAEWAQRRSEAADIILTLLEEGLTATVSKNVGDGGIERDYQRERVEAGLNELYREKIRDLERRHHHRLIELYRHSDVEFGDDGGELEGLPDLFTDETWQVFGLNPQQWAAVCALMGAAAGGAIDIGTGGATHGVATALGAASGYLYGMFGGRSLAKRKIKLREVKMPIGGVQVRIGLQKNDKLPWMLLGRVLFHYRQLISRSHGRRDAFVIDWSELAEDDRHFAGNYLRDHIRKLTGWFKAVAKNGGSRSQDDGEVYEILRDVLRKVEHDAGVEGG
jgi:hypothetical protein